MNEVTKHGPDHEMALALLGPESAVAAVLEGFEPRSGQIAMAERVVRALRLGEPLVAEAGTGTGKTLAYLLPAVASGLKVVVSTGTKTLQDQVATKELPLIKRAAAPHLSWAVLKGRGNYLCRRRYLALKEQPDLGMPGAESALMALDAWLTVNRGGDLDQIRGGLVSEAFLSEATANAEQCLGGRCPRRDECFLMEARRKAAEADVVVVNHHLFLADLRLRSEGHGEALPRYQAVIFDEAHLVPEVATAAFGTTATSQRLAVLLKDLLREAPAGAVPAEQARVAQAAGEAFFARVRKTLGQNGRQSLSAAALEALAGPGRELAGALTVLAASLDKRDEEEAQALGQRAAALALDLEALAAPAAGHTVAWAERRGRGVALHLSPVEVAPHLEQSLFAERGRVVMTSATLAPVDDLEPFRRRVGLPEDTDTILVPSPFDLARRAVLYVPRRMPAPGSPAFPEAVAAEVAELVEASRGRAFVLFTSHRNLEAVSAMLEDRLGYPCLVQGQAPRLELLQRFVEESPSVLFATASFWQGVDVPGPALSAVIIDKLPFAPPDDPLVAARCQLAEDQGHSGFGSVSLPEAILSLKQGLGRLLRTVEDRGLLAVLDNRLVTKGYGRRFLKALAPVPLTHEIEDVHRFFEWEEDV